MYDVELTGVGKSFGRFTALEEISLSVRRGEFLTLLGPSGCGKTTLMKIIAGLFEPSSGEVVIRGNRVNGLAPYERDVSLMFQNYALFPHKTVFDNVAFGLKYRGFRREDRKQQVARILEIVRLPGIEDRHPDQLSGGQQQRVALARALVVNPAVLLLDEPLSNLDQKLRMGMRLELKQIQESLGVTFVFVTHDQNEALALSDRVAVMNTGRILQVGSPREIYERPTSRFVADFIGQSNFVNGEVIAVSGQDIRFRTETGLIFTGIAPGRSVEVGSRRTLQIRAEHLSLSTESPSSENCFQGHVERVVYEGTAVIYKLVVGGGESLTVSEPGSRRQSAQAGTAVWATFLPGNCVLLDA